MESFQSLKAITFDSWKRGVDENYLPGQNKAHWKPVSTDLTRIAHYNVHCTQCIHCTNCTEIKPVQNQKIQLTFTQSVYRVKNDSTGSHDYIMIAIKH